MTQGKCNLFKPVDNPTGTFFLFSQYTQDLTEQYTNPDKYRCLPSKFIALNLDFSNIQPTNDLTKAQFLGTIFQNYFENACTFLRDRYAQEKTNGWNPEYSRTLLFQTLEKYRMLTYDRINNTDAGEHTDGTTGKTYGATDVLSKSIQYIGDINIYSNVDGENGVGYNEIYCYIPNEAKCKDYNMVATQHLNRYFYGTKPGVPYLKIMGYENANPFNGLGSKSYQTTIGNIKYTDNDYYGLGTYYGTYQETEMDLNTLIPYVLKTKYDEKQSDSVVINDETLTGDDREDSSFKVNAIVVMYDIVEKTDDIRGVVKYKNIPLGIYFTGCLEDGSNEMTNTITKYVTNDTIYGQGTSYGLRICTRFLADPNSTAIIETTTESSTNIAEMAPVLEQMADTLTGINDLLDNEDKFHQTIKDHLANFKNNKVNIPYVRQLGTKKYWFVNGKNTGAVAQFEISGIDDIVKKAVEAVLELVYTKVELNKYLENTVTMDDLNKLKAGLVTEQQLNDSVNKMKNDIIEWLKVYLNGE